MRGVVFFFFSNMYVVVYSRNQWWFSRFSFCSVDRLLDTRVRRRFCNIVLSTYLYLCNKYEYIYIRRRICHLVCIPSRLLDGRNASVCYDYIDLQEHTSLIGIFFYYYRIVVVVIRMHQEERTKRWRFYSLFFFLPSNKPIVLFFSSLSFSLDEFRSFV